MWIYKQICMSGINWKHTMILFRKNIHISSRKCEEKWFVYIISKPKKLGTTNLLYSQLGADRSCQLSPNLGRSSPILRNQQQPVQIGHSRFWGLAGTCPFRVCWEVYNERNTSASITPTSMAKCSWPFPKKPGHKNTNNRNMPSMWHSLGHTSVSIRVYIPDFLKFRGKPHSPRFFKFFSKEDSDFDVPKPSGDCHDIMRMPWRL